MSSGRKMRLGVMTSCKVTLMHMSGPTLKFSSALSCILGFPGGSAGKESACNGGDLGLIPGLGRSLGEEWQPTPVFLPGESPWTEEPGGIQPMGVQRVGHN